MATPPRVTRMEVDAALARIHWRHAKVDDPRRSGLSDDPASVLEHLTRHSTTLPPWVIAADTLDGLVLTTWLWWEDRRRERALLRRGLYVGLTYRELGAPLGITSRQGLRDRLDRLETLLARERPDEKLARAARRASAATRTAGAWTTIHSERIRNVIGRLLTEIDRVPELAALRQAGERAALAEGTDGEVRSRPLGAEDSDHSAALSEAAEWLAELRADVDDGVSPATLSVLGLALAPLRLALRRVALDPAHGLWRAIREADQLRSEGASQ